MRDKIIEFTNYCKKYPSRTIASISIGFLIGHFAPTIVSITFLIILSITVIYIYKQIN